MHKDANRRRCVYQNAVRLAYGNRVNEEMSAIGTKRTSGLISI